MNDRDGPQQILIFRYRVARQLWNAMSGIREVATLVGMNEREFCDRYVQHCWESLSSHGKDELDYDDAFAASGDEP